MVPLHLSSEPGPHGHLLCSARFQSVSAAVCACHACFQPPISMSIPPTFRTMHCQPPLFSTSALCTHAVSRLYLSLQSPCTHATATCICTPAPRMHVAGPTATRTHAATACIWPSASPPHACCLPHVSGPQALRVHAACCMYLALQTSACMLPAAYIWHSCPPRACCLPHVFGPPTLCVHAALPHVSGPPAFRMHAASNMCLSFQPFRTHAPTARICPFGSPHARCQTGHTEKWPTANECVHVFVGQGVPEPEPAQALRGANCRGSCNNSVSACMSVVA